MAAAAAEFLASLRPAGLQNLKRFDRYREKDKCQVKTSCQTSGGRGGRERGKCGGARQLEK